MSLDESERLLNLASRLTPMGAWAYEVQSGRFHWSEAALQILALPSLLPEATLETVLNGFAPEERPALALALKRAHQDGHALEHQFAMVAPDGTARVLAFTGTSHHAADGSITALYGSLQDVTHLRLADAQLRASEVRYRRIVESAQDPVLWIARRGEIEFASPSVERWGFRRADLVGRGFGDFVHPEDRHEILAWFDGLIDGQVEEAAVLQAFRWLDACGEAIWIEAIPAVVRDADGQASSVVVTLRDVTQRRGLERRAREQAELVEAAFQQAVSGKALLDLDLRFLKINPALCTMLGLAEADLIQTRFERLMHPDERGGASLAADRLRNGEIRSYQVDRRYRHANGTYVPVRVSVSLVRGAEGATQHLLVEAEDRTEYVAASAARRESEDLYRLLAENIGDIVIKNNLDGIIEYVSPSIKRLTGLDPDKWIGKHLNDRIVVDKEFRTPKFTEHEKPLPTGRDNEFQYRRADGSLGWVQSNPTILRDPDGRPAGMMSVLRDVTERRAIEDELRRKTAEAEAAVQAKAEFLANMSHEIRTPLTAVIGFGDLLAKMSDLPEKSQLYAQRIASSGEALLGIVNSVLDFSRVEAGEVELQRQSIDPVDLAGQILDQFRDKAAARGLALTLEVEEPLPVAVLADRGRLGQVITNLLANAVKFTRQGGITIRLGYDLSAQSLQFAVADTGIGIPQGQAGRLFERFTQIDGSHTRQFGGVGLGLAISRGLVELMGGDIRVESEEGVGSTFRFTVHAPPVIPGQVSAAAVAEDHDVAPIRILVVDDVTVNRELISAMLEPFELRLTEAEDGQAAVEAAEREAFDLILMDVQMPRMNGLSATKVIRAKSKLNCRTPILALSANVLPQHVDECLWAGMNDHIGKPINVGELLSKIEQWTRAEDPRG
jgi:PAS domain S-box-containing protein